MVDMGRIEAHNAATALVNSQLLGRVIASVVDPDQDPYVFEPPGSGSGSFYTVIKQKK